MAASSSASRTRIEMDSMKVPPCFEIFGTLCLLRTHTNIILT